MANTKKNTKILQYMPQEEGFLGIEEEYLAKPENAKAVVVPFGLEASVCYGAGTRVGPSAIIKASQQLEFFDEDHWCETYRKFGVATVEQPVIERLIPAALDQLEEIVSEIVDQDKFPLILGGEHSITAGSIRPFVKKYPDLAILHFDAHADLRDGFEGEHYSHAAALRRVMDNPISTLISCGIRNISQSEIPYLEENKDRITIHWAKDIRKWNVE